MYVYNYTHIIMYNTCTEIKCLKVESEFSSFVPHFRLIYAPSAIFVLFSSAYRPTHFHRHTYGYLVVLDVFFTEKERGKRKITKGKCADFV